MPSSDEFFWPVFGLLVSSPTYSDGLHGLVARYIDDFTRAYGSVFLCGLSMQGEAGVRVHGIAPVWCWPKTEISLSKPWGCVSDPTK